MNTAGRAARGKSTRPPPPSVTGASCRRAVSVQAAPAVDTRADFTCCGDHPGWSWSRSAAPPLTCGADILVPSKTANGAPLVNSGRVDERIDPPGAETSGFKRCSNAVGPPDEKLVMIPLRPVSTRWIRLPIVTFAAPPVVARYVRRRAPSRSLIMQAGSGSWIGIEFASPGRLSTSTSATAPARAARSAFETNVQCPRETSAMSPLSDPGCSGERASLFVSLSGPQSLRSTGLPSTPVRAPTSTSLCPLEANEPGKRVPPDPAVGICCRLCGAPGVRTARIGVKTCVFETAATVIASGAVPGEPTEPRPKSSRSFPAEMTDTTPAAATLCTTSIIASFAGSVSAPPPEKLITSMPSRTADSKAAAISGVFAVSPIGVGMSNTR